MRAVNRHQNRQKAINVGPIQMRIRLSRIRRTIYSGGYRTSKIHGSLNLKSNPKIHDSFILGKLKLGVFNNFTRVNKRSVLTHFRVHFDINKTHVVWILESRRQTSCQTPNTSPISHLTLEAQHELVVWPTHPFFEIALSSASFYSSFSTLGTTTWLRFGTDWGCLGIYSLGPLAVSLGPSVTVFLFWLVNLRLKNMCVFP